MQKQKKMLEYAQSKLKKCEKNVTLCKVRIEKKCRPKKIFLKKKFTLSSLEYSISLGQYLNSHMPFPTFAYNYFFGQGMQFFKYLWAILIDTYRKSLQTFSS